MKTRITILLVALFVSFNMGFAQQDEECMNNLSIFDSYYKSKKYDDAYGPWKIVREKCPKFNQAIYAYGDNILEHKIENSSGAEQVAFIKDLMLLYDQSHEHYPSKYSLGDMLVEKAQLAYSYKDELNMTDQQVYNMFDEAYKKDPKNFTSAKGLYTYFSLAVDIFDAGAKSPDDAQKMFDKYDDVMELIEGTEKDYIEKLNKLLEKEEAGTQLTKKEGKYKANYEANLGAFESVKSGMDQKIGERANCEVLVPLYEKDFEQFKNDAVWLQRAMDRMYQKGCKDDPLFLKLVEQKNNIAPSGNTAFYLYTITGEQKYFDQTIQLEQDPLKKARLYKQLGGELMDKGNYSKARQYFMKSLELNPSDGSPYLYIAQMYAKSANNCGDTNFNKRAVFWLAANEARKAGRVDSRLTSNANKAAASYEASAPSKADIFSSTMGGKTIQIGCWIGRSITVPN
ncbi:tetratricopeptide repeat protein [Winogradskyella ursingii]|uniref:tetratricopeptide repeat protein n=1 Tax=Winogradskyella ursingii TaxID=2686079 RepID=UPI0015CB3C38|nr:tetratricopeptide repeat protein [Winogradskyella ursingii]